MKRRTALKKMILSPLAVKMAAALGASSLMAQTPGASGLRVEDRAEAGAGEVALVAGGRTADIYVDPNDFEVVRIAAGLVADDVERVTGRRPAIKSNAAELGPNAVIMGTLGKSRAIDQIAAARKIDTAKIQGWEAYGIKAVDKPFPGVRKALVIAGSDRRGTAYGAMDLCRQVGVSPWYWWADVPVRKRQNLVAATGGEQISASPSVKYRGIFINEELWGLQPWATETFDPELNDMGPKTYRKIFELMLRLRLNYLWPSMVTDGNYLKHPFAGVPGNCELADQWAIVMGSSHCEPMLRNISFWNTAKQGPYNFVTNRETILNYWKQSAESRGKYEAVWTLGMRGAGDGPMEGADTTASEIALLEKVFHDQQELLKKYVDPLHGGKVAECFVPYNEVLQIMDGGLKVPNDVTIVWPNDSWGYIRQLPNAAQQRRRGGNGIYYHVAYVGPPVYYCWFSTTPPSKIWEEMRKAWDNQTRTLWVLNIGSLQSQQIDTDFWASFAWNVDAFGPQSQPVYLKQFAAESFGPENASEIASILGEFFRLCLIRKPSTMDSTWAAALDPEFSDLLMRQYHGLRNRAEKVAAKLPEEMRAAYFEMVLFPVRMLLASGATFIDYEHYLDSRDDPAKAQEYAASVRKWKRMIHENTRYYNDILREGKWKRMMIVGGCPRFLLPKIDGPVPERLTKLVPSVVSRPSHSLGAAQFTRKFDFPRARWQVIEGLGWSGRAVALEKMVAANEWGRNLARAPRLEYDLRLEQQQVATGFDVLVHVLPTYQLTPEIKLRVAAAIGREAPQFQEVTGSDPIIFNKVLGTHPSYPASSTNPKAAEALAKRGTVRAPGQLDNRTTLRFSFPGNGHRRQRLKIWTPDPGVVLDQIEIRTRT